MEGVLLAVVDALEYVDSKAWSKMAGSSASLELGYLSAWSNVPGS